MKKVVFCAPVYNEEHGIEGFLQEVQRACEPFASCYKFEVLLVNDGSRDGTARRIQNTACTLPVTLVNFSRNFGHPAACAALLDMADADAIVLLDADMQDDPYALAPFLQKWEEGYDCVYAIRTSRKESLVSRVLFKSFYRLLSCVSSVELPLDSGNFSLIDKKILPILRSFAKKNRYLPGMRAYAGFRQCGVGIERKERYDDTSRVGFKGLMRLAMNAIYSFSFVPVRIFGVIGVLGLLFAVGLFFYAMADKLMGNSVPAWASQIISIAFFGSINILGISIVGEYLARIYDILNGSPPYIVDNVWRSEDKDVVRF